MKKLTRKSNKLPLLLLISSCFFIITASSVSAQDTSKVPNYDVQKKLKALALKAKQTANASKSSPASKQHQASSHHQTLQHSETQSVISDVKNNPDLPAAIAVAEDWLALLDTEQYKAAWQQLGTSYKLDMPESQWLVMVKARRSPKGKFIERVLDHHKLAEPGKFKDKHIDVYLYYNAQYENKSKAVEHVTLENEDGKLVITGYYLF